MARVNTSKAVQAWIEGKTYRAPGRNGSPIWTCGGVLYSYNTAIGKWSDADGKLALLNGQRYSTTTSQQQNGVRSLLVMNGYYYVNLPTEEAFKLAER